MRHTTRTIAKLVTTAALGASLLFPGRVQKPMHDGIRQGVAVAEVKDAKPLTYDEIRDKVNGFKDVYEAMEFYMNGEKYGLIKIAETSKPARLIDKQDMEKLLRSSKVVGKKETCDMLEKFGFRLPQEMENILFNQYIYVDPTNIDFAGRTGLDPNMGFELYVVPVCEGNTIIAFMNRNYVTDVGPDNDMTTTINKDLVIIPIVFHDTQENKKTESRIVDGTHKPYNKQFKATVTFATAEDFRNTGKLATVYSWTQSLDGKYTVAEHELKFRDKTTIRIEDITTKEGIAKKRALCHIMLRILKFH